MAAGLKFWAFSFLVLFLLSTINRQVDSEPVQDKQALLAFLEATRQASSNPLQWNASASACDWQGVQCDATGSSVSALSLPRSGLSGPIPTNTLGRLTNLRVLNLQSNFLSGELPSDFSNLILLRGLYLQNNQFSGGFPGSITGMTQLTRIDLSSNSFNGPIPTWIGNLSQLSGLLLQNNLFSGNLPRLILPNLQDFNVSYNNLTGAIPDTLSSFPASAFGGNANLCGRPVTSCS